FTAQLEVLSLGDVELLAEREVEAAHARTAHNANTSITEGIGSRSGIGAQIQKLCARAILGRIMGSPDDVRTKTACTRTGGGAAHFDGQRESGMCCVDAAYLPTAQDHIYPAVQ